MRHIKRFSTWSDAHPLASMALGWIVLFAVVITTVAVDPILYPQHQHGSAT